MNKYAAALFVILWPAYWAFVYVCCRSMGWPALLAPAISAVTTYSIGWRIIRFSEEKANRRRTNEIL